MRRESGFLRAILLAGAAAVAALGMTALLVNVMERKEEARNPFFRVVELDDDVTDPAVWGKNFPLQWDGYRRTVDQVRTRYGGSEALPRTPDRADPRSIVAQSRLEEDPRLKILWAGYAFAVDFREERGHAYMLEDQTFTQRQQVVKQPGTCIHCHASVYVPYRKAGDGDLMLGFERMNRMPFLEARARVEHPVACIDCHDPQTMQLRVTRPGFLEGIRLVKGESYDPNRDATRQEMRSYVCGQCHVEYYFRGPEKRLVYPWHEGLRADQILEHYEKTGFADWTHGQSGAPVLKAQHPEFELWNQGIHARSGVACADCHMPYVRIGAMKTSDHHVRSPVLNLNRACQTCHHWPEEELRERIETIQTRTFEMRSVALDAIVALVRDVSGARDAGRTDEELREARAMQRRAQFLLDFVEAENSMGFHAPQEAMRLLALSLDATRRGQLAVRGDVAGATTPPAAPASGTPARER